MWTNKQNRRRTFANQVNAIKLYTQSNAFVDATSIELQTELDKLEKAFAGFVEEHQNVVQNFPNDQDRYFKEMEAVYTKAVVRLRTQIRRIETLQCTVKIDDQEPEVIEPMQINDAVGLVIDHSTKISDGDGAEGNHMVQSQVGLVKTSGFHQDLRDVLNGKSHRGAEHNSSAEYEPKFKKKGPLICNNCGSGEHPMAHCKKFTRRSIAERYARVRQLGVCRNCFAPMWMEYGRHRCREGACHQCGKMHNSLLCYVTEEEKRKEAERK